MENKELTVTKWVLIVRPKIPRMPQKKIQPKMSAQAQKLKIFEKKSSLWVSVVRGTKIAQGYRFSHAMGIMLWTFWQLKLFCILREYVFFYYLLQYIWVFFQRIITYC